MRASRAVTSLLWPSFATDWCFLSGTLAAACELCPGREFGWGSSCWAPCWPCLPSLLPSRTTPESRCPQRARTVLSGLATSSCPLRRRQAVQGAERLVWFRHEMTASRGPSAWRRCKEGKSGSSADSPFGRSASRGSPCRPPYSSCRRRPARRTAVRVSANLSRTWSSGSVSIDTAAWSAQGSDTWCTVSPVRQKPAPWTVWHRAIPHWGAPLLQGRSWRQERLLLAVVESDDPHYAMPSRFQILRLLTLFTDMLCSSVTLTVTCCNALSNEAGAGQFMTDFLPLTAWSQMPPVSLSISLCA